MKPTIRLPVPPILSAAERRLVQRYVRGAMAEGPTDPSCSAACRAAIALLRDLRGQGWAVEWSRGLILVSPPVGDRDVVTEKERVRVQERMKRDEQLGSSSVRRFIQVMERPREHSGRFCSIFSLMRDGEELCTKLEAAHAGERDLKEVIDPYLQVVDASGRCEWTGLRLMDVWRYFRHTWSNQYVSTPGRSMPILVRDRAAANHPVIGIASLGSAIVQLSHRDQAIGWGPPEVLDRMCRLPTDVDASWLCGRLESWRSELHTVDLASDGLWSDEWWRSPDGSKVEALELESAMRRKRHQRLGRKADFATGKSVRDDQLWLERAQTDLFRSKRCALAAELLRARVALDACFVNPSASGLAAALSSPSGRRSAGWIVRRAKAETVGTEIADITVCGAVAPYSHLLGGKLVASLLASPTVVRAYREKYRDQPSEIASSMAGRTVVRPASLVYLGTSSLYGAGSSQYNRIRIPAEVLGSSSDLKFAELGRSRSFGTSHLSQDTVSFLSELGEQALGGARVKSIFGEGASPKLRKVREGMDILGWPSEELLRHRRERIIYGVELAEKPGDYLLRRRQTPQYLFDVDRDDDVGRIADWWRTRWLSPRSRRTETLDAVREHTTQRPVRHGARVELPRSPESDIQLPGLDDEHF